MPVIRRRLAFSMLELLIVLAILGMVAALVAPTAMRMSLGDSRDQAVLELGEALGAARLDALRESQAVAVEIVLGDGALSATWADRERRWERWPLGLVDAGGRPLVRTDARFGATGLSNVRDIRFVDADTGRMWVIEFDPVSGAPSWRTTDDGAN